MKFDDDLAIVYYEPGTATVDQMVAALATQDYQAWDTRTETKRIRRNVPGGR